MLLGFSAQSGLFDMAGTPIFSAICDMRQLRTVAVKKADVREDDRLNLW
jgi:hypothetical protein